MVSAQLVLTVPLLAPALSTHAEAPPTEPLDAHVVDASSYPTVVLDVVIPWQFRTADVDAGMIELEGGTVDSVAPVQRAGTVVGLVIDDGPEVRPGVVYDAQGASVELVRNVGQGTAIALSTPSGLQTTPTTDRGASIARIAGITAGAPDVVPLNRLVLGAAERLASGAWPDRHLVLVLGRPVTAAPTLSELTNITVGADVRVHVVVADPDIDASGVNGVAERTGGVAGGDGIMLAEVDAITAAIAHRVRVTATVDDPGRHEIALTVDGARFTADVNVPAPAVPPTTTVTTEAVDGTVAPEVASVPPETNPPATVSASSEAVPPRPMWIAVALITFGVAALTWLWLSARRRRRTRGPDPSPTTAPEPAAPEPAAPEPAAATPARPRRGPPAPALEPLPEPVAVTGGPAAPTTGRRPTSRPRRATPARRAPANVEQPDVTEPAEPEPEPEGQAEWLVVGRVRLSRRTGDVFSGTRRISLSPAQFAVLELLMTRGGHGVTRDAIRAAAAATGANGEEAPDLDNVEDLDAFVAELRRKTGISGRGQGVRQERANVYFFGE